MTDIIEIKLSDEEVKKLELLVNVLNQEGEAQNVSEAAKTLMKEALNERLSELGKQFLALQKKQQQKISQTTQQNQKSEEEAPKN